MAIICYSRPFTLMRSRWHGEKVYYSSGVAARMVGMKTKKSELSSPAPVALQCQQLYNYIVTSDMKDTRQRDPRKSTNKGSIPPRVEWEDIFNAIGHPAFILDRQHKVLAANNGSAKLTDIPHNEIIGKQCHEIFHGKDVHAPVAGCPMKQMLKSDNPETVEMELETLAGTFLVSCTPVYDNEGNLEKAIHIATDITDRKQAETALRKSTARLQSIFDAAPTGIGVVHNRVIIEANNRICEMTGRTRDELVGKNARLLYPTQEDFEFVGREKYRQIADRGTGSVETRWIRKDGSILNVLLSSSPVDPGDLSAGVTFTATDITERKQIYDARMFLVECGSKGEDFFRALARYLAESLAMDYVCIDSLEGDLLTARTVAVYFDGRFEDNVSYTLHDTPCGEVVGTDVCLFPDGVRHRFPRDVVLQDMKANSYVGVTLWSHDHRPIGLIAVIGRQPLADPKLAESILKLVAIRAAGELERKRAEEELRESEQRLDLALRSAHMGVWRWEIKENRRYFDALTCQLLGIDAATFTGAAEDFFRVVHPDDREKIKSALTRTIEQDVIYRPAYRVVWPDGSLRYITARGRLVRGDKGEPVRISGILWDITEQRLLEEERMNTQKLEAVGTLAGGIAHDFNNLLQGIFGYISMAKFTLDQKERSLAMLEQAEQALHMSVNLTTQLLTFSKGGKPVKRKMLLQPVIENSVKFALSGSRSEYHLELDEGLWAVEADEGQIGQVIQNIVLNADQAMPEGGAIVITAKNIPSPERAHYKLLTTGKYVEVSIKDTGIGISELYLQKIFEPYFTTKEKGSGLGLATSYSIVNNHGGVIDVSSELGKSTTFFIYLPAVEAAREIREEYAGTPAAGKGKILVMDDEEFVLNIAGEMIKALGHEVDFAKDGDSAIEKCHAAMKSGRPYDIVILDLTIRGGMGGRETVGRLLSIDNTIRAIVSSGYSDNAVMSDYHKYGFKARLSKPYKLEDLRRTLSDLLG